MKNMADSENAAKAVTSQPWGEAACESIAFVGNTLSPLFLEDPLRGNAGPVLAALHALDVPEAAANWPFVDDTAAAADALAAMAGSFDPDDAASMEQLAREYRRLFVGPGKLPAPPWGSVYTDKEGVIFGEGNLQLRAWLRAHGIERSTAQNAPDDHMGNLLALTATVAAQQPGALDELLALHLLPWSSHYLEQLRAAAEHPFCQGLADLARLTLEAMGGWRGLEVQQPEFFR